MGSAWQQKWPDVNIEELRPCRQPKKSVQGRIPGVILEDDCMYECKTAGPTDPVFSNGQKLKEAWDEATRMKPFSYEQLQAVYDGFNGAAKDGSITSWESLYESHAKGEAVLYRCILSCTIRPEGTAPEQPLVGSWCYDFEGDYYKFTISQELHFSESHPDGGTLSGELRQVDDVWWEARTSMNGGSDVMAVRLRFCKDESTLEVQSRQASFPYWSPSLYARKFSFGYVGYGVKPFAAMACAMQKAMQDPFMPVSITKRGTRPLAPRSKQPLAARGKPLPPARQSCPRASASEGRFEAAKKLLSSLLEAMASLLKHVQEATGDHGVAEDDLEQRQDILLEVAQHLDALVGAVCDMLSGDDPIPLTDPCWSWNEYRLPKLAWQYGFAANDKDILRRLGQAFQSARGLLASALPSDNERDDGGQSAPSPSEETATSSIEAEPDAERALPGRDIGMPVQLWKELVDSCVWAAHMDPPDKSGGIAEEGLIHLPPSLLPADMDYAGHFLHLLQFDRISELRQAYAKEQEDPVFLECDGSWDYSKPQHRPEVKLSLPLDQSPRVREAGSNLHKNCIALLMPFQSSNWDQAVPVELRSEPQRESSKEMKFKLGSVTLPAGGLCDLFRATRFKLVPLRNNRVTYDRQVDAIRSTISPSSSIHPAVRSMILDSWDTQGGKEAVPSSGPALCAASQVEESPPVQQPSPRALAAEQPEDLPTPATGSPDQDMVAASGISLTERQQLVVKDASNRRCTLVRGPPGTGKTHTACAIVERWLAIKDSTRVLVVTQSNVAALNIQERLEQFSLPSVRVGLQMKPEDFLNQRHFKSLFEPKELQPLRDAMAADNEMRSVVSIPLLQKAIQSSQVVVMTCISSGNMSLVSETSFHRILFDEAAQATEPTALVPLMTGAAAFACVGDDRQLPATIISCEAKRRGLDKSLFERFLQCGVVTPGDGFVQLDVQRRMHSSIARFPSMFFYEGSISNGVEDEDRPALPGIKWPRGGQCRVLFVDTAGRGDGEEKCGASLRNVAEADLLVRTLVHIRSAHVRSRVHFDTSQVACITAYAAQREQLFQCLARARSLASVKVDTVDGFQGMERDLVLVSCTRSNRSGDVGFLRDARRANVLLTRARRGLIVFGDYMTMSKDSQVWAPWLRWVDEQGCVTSIEGLQQDLLDW